MDNQINNGIELISVSLSELRRDALVGNEYAMCIKRQPTLGEWLSMLHYQRNGTMVKERERTEAFGHMN